MKFPTVLSVLALVVAIAAAAGVYRGEEKQGLDRAAIEAIVTEQVTAQVASQVEERISALDSSGSEALDPEKVGPVVRDYMVANPGILEEVLAALEAKRQQDQVASRSDALDANRERIFRSPASPVVGNPAGDITLVEFFDYNCGYCKRMLPALLDLMESDPKLRVVFKEWPVLTDGSAEAARVALAVLKVAPQQYLDFHVELMSQPAGNGGVDGKRALQVAEDLGIDRAAVEEAAKSPEIDTEISETFKVAEALGLRGTPSYVVGNEVIPGAVSYEELQAKIAEARKTECQTC